MYSRKFPRLCIVMSKAENLTNKLEFCSGCSESNQRLMLSIYPIMANDKWEHEEACNMVGGFSPLCNKCNVCNIATVGGQI